MSDLRSSLTKLDLSEVQTYIQSGNIVFNSNESDAKLLESQIKSLIETDFNLDVPVIIRGKEAFLDLIEYCPFEINETSLKQIHFTFLKEEVAIENQNILNELIPSDEELVFLNQDIILKCGERYSQTKLNNGYIEKKLKVSTTTRNLKTVLKLKELVCER